MRNHGNLTKWNEERGFGFITPANGVGEIFVHVSAFPRGNQRPEIGELISYITETTSDGKLRAIQVMRPGQTATPRRKPVVTFSLASLAFTVALFTSSSASAVKTACPAVNRAWPNNSYNVAGKAGHVVGSTTQVDQARRLGR